MRTPAEFATVTAMACLTPNVQKVAEPPLAYNTKGKGAYVVWGSEADIG